MKKYYVTVNGNRYQVEVEEVQGDFEEKFPAAPGKAAETAQKPEAKEVEPAAEAPAPKPASAPKDVPEGGEKINCPMPGTIVGVNVKEGDNVKKGDLLFILEAMKMENEIVSPRDGKIITVAVSKGQMVNTDDLLVVIE